MEGRPSVWLATDTLLCAGADQSHQAGVAGQEPLWILCGSSGKHQGKVNGVSEVNGERQKLHLPASDQVEGRRVKRGNK